MNKRYPDCQRDDGDCAICSLVNYSRDCHNNPVNEIAFIRSRVGLTQAQASAQLGIPRRTWEDWERGVRTPPDYVVNMIEQCLKPAK